MSIAEHKKSLMRIANLTGMPLALEETKVMSLEELEAEINKKIVRLKEADVTITLQDAINDKERIERIIIELLMQYTEVTGLVVSDITLITTPAGHAYRVNLSIKL